MNLENERLELKPYMMYNLRLQLLMMQQDYVHVNVPEEILVCFPARLYCQV